MRTRSRRPAPGSAWMALGLLVVSLGSIQAQTQQLRSDARDEGWGNRQSNTSQGELLWFEHDGVSNTDDVYLYDGASANLVQAQGGLTGVGDNVFALGTGTTAGHVIAAWRRETDFAWISVDGNTPLLVQATNPIDAMQPLNPEGAAIADGCAFLILQGFSGGLARKFVYRVDPSTGNATILTDPATFPITGTDDGVPRITTSGCKAAWRFFDGSGVTKLHFYDGASVHVIDSGEVDLPHLSRGRLVYAKTVDGVSQVFLYDSNLPSPVPVPITSYLDPAKTNSHAKTDGRHVAWLRQNLDGSSRQIVLNGDLPLTTSATKPADGSVSIDFPIQLQRGQLLWTDASGNLRYFHGGAIETVAISPATSVIRPWLADGYVAFTGLSNDGGTDTEPFRFAGTPPSDAIQPSAPLLLAATHGDGQITVAWDRILGATSYNLYSATATGVTKGNYASLPGGTRVTGVTSPHAVTGLANGTTYYFVVTAVDGTGEGPESAEASATPKAPHCVSAGNASCYSTVQAAIDAASPGDVIRIVAGNYVESKTASNNLTIDRTVTLEGGWNSALTIRNPAAYVTTLRPANPDFSVVDIEGQFGNPDAVAPVLDGFTITGATGGNHGGGIRIRDSNAVVRNCVITGNQAYLLGGGIWVQRGGPRLERNRIENNSVTPGGNGGGVELESTQATLVGNAITGNQIADVAGSGGGVAVDGGGLVTLTGNTITGNAAANQVGAATDAAYGGGVSINGATAYLTGNLIQGNAANSAVAFGFGGGNGSGGGVAIVNSQAFTLAGNTIRDNIGGYLYYKYMLGGGIFADSSQGQMFDNVISGNKANGNVLFGNGAGLAAVSSTLTIGGGRIADNTVSINCEGYGGGLYADNSTVTLDGVRVEANCAGNTPFYGKGGGLAFISSAFTVTNSVVAANKVHANDTAVGGIFAGLDSVTKTASPGVLVNDTIAGNKGRGVETGFDLTLTNTIVSGQTTGVAETGTGTVTATYNDFFNNGTNYSGFSLGTGNRFVDPLWDASYRPGFGSGVVDAGTNTGCPGLDLLGVPRPEDGNLDGIPTCDMGAFELAFAVTQIAPTSGPAAGGSGATISGALFDSGASVEIGGKSVSSLIRVNQGLFTGFTPSLAPGTLNDVVVTNPGPASAALPRAWLADFSDVPQAHLFHGAVEKIFRAGITTGCGGGKYCPGDAVNRASMAAFILRGEHGASYLPPAPAGNVFADVTASTLLARWIEAFAAEGITTGCGSDNYCPGDLVNRASIAVFLLRAKHGASYQPPPATGTVFADVTTSTFLAKWIEELANEGITSGCGGGNYCPGSTVTRGEMAALLKKTFALP